jgi:hypothetical protein
MARRDFARKPNQYVLGLMEHFKLRRQGVRTGRGGVVNDCWKPGAGASKEDLAEYHREEMALRKRRRAA